MAFFKREDEKTRWQRMGCFAQSYPLVEPVYTMTRLSNFRKKHVAYYVLGFCWLMAFIATVAVGIKNGFNFEKIFLSGLSLLMAGGAAFMGWRKKSKELDQKES